MWILILGVFFAPFPIVNYQKFSHVYTVDGQSGDVEMAVLSVRFHYLLSGGGTQDRDSWKGFVKLTEQKTGEEIFMLKGQNYMFSNEEGTYLAGVGETRYEEASNQMIPYTGEVCFDDGLENVAVHIRDGGTGDDIFYLASEDSFEAAFSLYQIYSYYWE